MTSTIEPPPAPEPPAPPGPGRSQAWSTDPRTLALIAAIFVAILALVALASTASRSSDPQQPDDRRETSADAQSDLRNRDVDVRPIPGCPGGFAINDRVFVVPDPEACGLELRPGDRDIDPNGRIFLVPSPDGNIGGFRFDANGNLELLPPGQVRPDDFFLEQAPDGSFRLSWPDGSGYEISPGDDGLSFRQRAGQGEGDGELPNFDGRNTPQFENPNAFDDFDDFEDSQRNDGGGLNWDLSFLLPVLIAIAIIGLLIGAWYALRNREWGGDDDAADEPDVEPEAPVSYAAEISALDRMLWEIDQEPDPRLAIQRVYAALETGLGNPEMAREFHETPGVYLQRILGRLDALQRPLRQLTDLFEQARFSEHEITSAMRDQAVTTLVEVRGAYANAAAQADLVAAAPASATPVPGPPAGPPMLPPA